MRGARGVGRGAEDKVDSIKTKERLDGAAAAERRRRRRRLPGSEAPQAAPGPPRCAARGGLRSRVDAQRN